MSLQILDALQVVSYRIAAIGLEPEFVRSYPAIERYESPFLMQNVEVHAFIADRRSAATEKRDPAIDDKHLLMLLDQCKTIIDKVRKQAAQRSEEHTSELQSLMRISYAVFCLKKKKHYKERHKYD